MAANGGWSCTWLLLLVALCPCKTGVDAAAVIPRVVRSSNSSASPQEVISLPGLQGTLRSRQYSGYINVDVQNDRNLFYWVVHSEYSLHDDPVVLWLTGGPGCSSLDALIYENGPFKFHLDGDQVHLEDNTYSWSKAATMIYVDSPAGAGLSYSNTPSDYVTNNERTIDDLYTFLQQLLLIMPELAQQDFYLAGESYAGVYVPLLARKILEMNEQAIATTMQDQSNKQRCLQINIKGYLLGNAVADDMREGNGQWEFAYGHGLIDPATYSDLQEACNNSFWNPGQGSTCQDKLKDARDVFYWVNPYSILQPCFIKAGGGRDRDLMGIDSMSVLGHQHSQALTAGHGDLDKSALRLGHLRAWGPRAWVPRGLRHTIACGDRRAATIWLSMPETRRAIHAASASEVPWTPCSDILNYTIPFPISMVDLHKDLAHKGLRVLMYSGDHDFIVPYTGTRSWVYSMQLPVERPYAAWMIDKQVAGFLTVFQPHFLFATVKGGGHMVPTTNPREALTLFSRFLQQEL